MHSYDRVLTKHLKRYDRDLFVDRNMEGTPCVFRKTRRAFVYHLDGFGKITDFEESRQFIMALTENWATTSRPVLRGIEPVVQRLKSIDSQNNERIIDEMEEMEAKEEESKKRALLNETEAFMSDYRSEFQRTFADINTANMSKVDPRKKKEKRIKN